MTRQRRQQLISKPININFIQSSNQCFYFVESNIVEKGDTIVAYNGDIVVGYRKWNGQHTDIPVMGFDSDVSESNGYMSSGDIPSFKLLKSSGKFINLNGEIPSWQNVGVHHITLELDKQER